MHTHFSSKSAFQPVQPNSGAGTTSAGAVIPTMQYPQSQMYNYPPNQFYAGHMNPTPQTANTQQMSYNYSNPYMQYNQNSFTGGAIGNSHWNTVQGSQPASSGPSIASNNLTASHQKTSSQNDNINASQTLNSESSLSSSPEHSAGESSPAGSGSGAEGGESESADSDTISGTTNRSEHLNNQHQTIQTSSGATGGTVQSRNVNSQYNSSQPVPKSSVLGKRPAANPGGFTYPTPVRKSISNCPQTKFIAIVFLHYFVLPFFWFF